MTDQTFDLDATHPQEGPERAPRSDEQGSRVPVEGQGSERPANHAGAILNLDAIRPAHVYGRCGHLVHDQDGLEAPCDRPTTGWHWYQDVGHEDALGEACDLHVNAAP